MKKFLIMILALFCISAYSQTEQKYDLKWKVDKDNPIAFKTSMEPIDTNNLLKTGFDCNDYLNAFSDTADFNCDDFEDFFEALNSLYSDYSIITTLTLNNKETIDVKLIATQNATKSNLPDSIPDFFKNAFKGVQLRGKINSDGGIESFYMKKEQMNLLALMFELPTQPVKIGDRWKIQASFISNDHNFICDDYGKKHNIELVDVRIIDGDEIAFIKYDINYYVNGVFNNPVFGKAVPTTMDVTYNGISEFNITKGKWRDYNGIMSMDVTGFMNNQSRQRFKLSEIDEIPTEVLNIN
jgi:hypothetical protein